MDFFFFIEKSFGEGCKSLYVLLFRGCYCSQKLCQFLNGIFSSMKSNISLKKNARKRESRVLSRVKMKQRNDGARSRNIPPNFHLVPFFARKFIRRAQCERRSICKPWKPVAFARRIGKNRNVRHGHVLVTSSVTKRPSRSASILVRTSHMSLSTRGKSMEWGGFRDYADIYRQWNPQRQLLPSPGYHGVVYPPRNKQ